MNATIPTLLIVATVAFAPQSTAQKTNQSREPVASTRVPVDVSLQGLGDVSGLALGDAARGGIVSVTPSVGSVSPLAFSCAPSIRDQSAGGCLQADTTPTLGRLHPLSPDFNLDAAGNVGIGTTTPQAKLQVDGTVRIDPAVDKALDIATGSIYRGGTLFLHNKGGIRNTALGRQALANITSGGLHGPTCSSIPLVLL